MWTQRIVYPGCRSSFTVATDTIERDTHLVACPHCDARLAFESDERSWSEGEVEGSAVPLTRAPESDETGSSDSAGDGRARRREQREG